MTKITQRKDGTEYAEFSDYAGDLVTLVADDWPLLTISFGDDHFSSIALDQSSAAELGELLLRFARTGKMRAEEVRLET